MQATLSLRQEANVHTTSCSPSSEVVRAAVLRLAGRVARRFCCREEALLPVWHHCRLSQQACFWWLLSLPLVLWWLGLLPRVWRLLPLLVLLWLRLLRSWLCSQLHGSWLHCRLVRWRLILHRHLSGE